MEKMYMVPFNNDSTPDNSLCTDGLNFSINEPFLLIANKPIPKHRKVYMEICVSKYSQISLKRNIPIYVGIHKEPAFGVLNSDFCIGSIFYTEGKDFDIMSKYNADAIDDHWAPDKIYSRIPGATDIIGIGVDYDNNLISIYNNGKLFYTITPKLFNMKDETNFYFCMWGNIPCALKGYVNFGKAGTDYLPKGYGTIYGQYYRSTDATNDIACDITVETDYSKSGKDVAGFVTVNNDIMGDGSLFLESNKAVLSNDNMSYKITHQDSSNYLMDGANVFCNLPIPDDCKVYAEFEIKDGSLIDNIIGIPASIGISNAKSTILSRSLRMPLYHKTWHKYTYTEVKDLAPTVYQITDVYTSVPPEEGKIVGVAMDLANNSVSIYVNKVLLYTFKARLNDFANRKAFYYLFLHDEGAFKNYISGTFNAGETLFAGSIPDGYISLYDYYNRFYKIKAYKDINCEIHVLPYYTEKDVYIHCDITVIPADTAESLRFDHPGLNKLMNTYNTIEDDETHTSVDKNITYLNSSIAVNNNGYCPEDKF